MWSTRVLHEVARACVAMVSLFLDCLFEASLFEEFLLVQDSVDHHLLCEAVSDTYGSSEVLFPMYFPCYLGYLSILFNNSY